MQIRLPHIPFVMAALGMVMASIPAAGADHRLGFGLDLWGQQEGRYDTTSEVRPGVDLLWEVTWPVTSRGPSSFGFGTEILLPRTTDASWDHASYSYLTLHAVGRWHPMTSKPGYLLAQFGVAFHRVTGGWYDIEVGDGEASPTWAVGGGLILGPHWSAELYLAKIGANHPEGRFSNDLNAYDRIALRFWYRR